MDQVGRSNYVEMKSGWRLMLRDASILVSQKTESVCSQPAERLGGQGLALQDYSSRGAF